MVLFKKSITGKKPSKGNVYIGLDFGTTYTKMSFKVARNGVQDLDQGSKIYSISPKDCNEFLFFNSNYYPSTLWYNPNNGSLQFLPEEGLVEVKYFKYTIISRELRTDIGGESLENDASRLCAAFYLASLIKRIKVFVCESKETKNFSELAWHINMGVPLNQFRSGLDSAYDEVLQIAWELHEKVSNQITVQELDKLYSQFKKSVKTKWNDNLHTIPELYAEILLFLRASQTPNGLYTVVDIGGGTVDIAVFLKRIENGIPKIRCISQIVSPIGNEILKKDGKAENIKKEMNKTYGTALMTAYKNHKTELQTLKNNGKKHQIFFLGGARDVKLYPTCITFMAEIHQNAVNIPCMEKRDILKFLDQQAKKLRLNVQNNRLVISQMLTIPFSMIPQLDGVSWK